MIRVTVYFCLCVVETRASPIFYPFLVRLAPLLIRNRLCVVLDSEGIWRTPGSRFCASDAREQVSVRGSVAEVALQGTLRLVRATICV